jgi:hypothetical protein
MKIAKNLLNRGMLVNDVAETTGLEVDEVLRM